MLAVAFALVTLTLLNNNDIDTVLIMCMCINNSHLYLSECLNKTKYKSNFQDLRLQSLVILTKLGA